MSKPTNKHNRLFFVPEPIVDKICSARISWATAWTPRSAPRSSESTPPSAGRRLPPPRRSDASATTALGSTSTEGRRGVPERNQGLRRGWLQVGMQRRPHLRGARAWPQGVTQRRDPPRRCHRSWYGPDLTRISSCGVRRYVPRQALKRIEEVA